MRLLADLVLGAVLLLVAAALALVALTAQPRSLIVGGVALLVALLALYLLGRAMGRVQERAVKRPWLLAPLSLLPVLAVVATLLGLEALASSTGWSRGLGVTLFRPSPVRGLGYDLRPGAVSRVEGVWYRINAEGLRGPELSERRRPGVPRVACVGDSLVMGIGLPLESSLPWQLGESLRRRFPSVESVNAGVAGYNWRQETILYRERVRRYRPHVTVVGFVLNDACPRSDWMWDDASAGIRPVRYAEFGPDVDNPRAPTAGRKGLLRRLAGRWFPLTLEFIKARLRRGARAPDMEGPYANGERATATWIRYFDSTQHPEGWQARRKDLLELCRAIRESGSKCVVLLYPTLAQVTGKWGDSDLPQRLAERLLAGEGIPCVNLLPVLKSAEGSPARYFIDALHLSAEGNHLAADALRPVVARLLADRGRRSGR